MMDVVGDDDLWWFMMIVVMMIYDYAQLYDDVVDGVDDDFTDHDDEHFIDQN